MANWDFLNRHRILTGAYRSLPTMGFNGAFMFPLQGEERLVCVIASDGGGWEHVSVSFGPVKGIPSWQIMCAVKDLFWEPEQWVVQFHPAMSEYVNHHEGCLHLWRCIDGREQPVPPAWMVGLVRKDERK